MGLAHGKEPHQVALFHPIVPRIPAPASWHARRCVNPGQSPHPEGGSTMGKWRLRSNGNSGGSEIVT